MSKHPRLSAFGAGRHEGRGYGRVHTAGNRPSISRIPTNGSLANDHIARHFRAGIKGSMCIWRLVDPAAERDPNFDFAEALFQIAIVLGSVSIVATSRALVKLSGGLAVVASPLMINGYSLIVHLPLE